MFDPITAGVGASLETVQKAAEVIAEKLVETSEVLVKESPVKQMIPVVENRSLESLKAENEIIRINTINMNLEDSVHPETGVPFGIKIIEHDKKIIEGVFPEFKSIFDVILPDSMLKASDAIQFDECNRLLKEAIEKNSELRSLFDEKQLSQIQDDLTPDGFTWHHDAEVGKMQLIDFEIHARTGHTGGRYIWGGGSEYR